MLCVVCFLAGGFWRAWRQRWSCGVWWRILIQHLNIQFHALILILICCGLTVLVRSYNAALVILFYQSLPSNFLHRPFAFLVGFVASLCGLFFYFVCIFKHVFFYHVDTVKWLGYRCA